MWFVTLSLIHLIFAIYCKYKLNVDIYNMEDWDWFWQHIPKDLLMKDPLTSIFYMHSQPPLWNTINAILINIFKDKHLEALQWFHIILGSIMSGMLFEIAKFLLKNEKLAIIVAIILSLNPSLVLFEASPMYDFFCASLIVSIIYFFIKFIKTSHLHHATLSLLLTFLLIMTRSLYHAFILIPIAFVIILIANRNQRPKLITISIILFTLSITWYTKNLILFGFFGSSSWYGLNLYKMVSSNYKIDDLKKLSSSNIIPEMVVELRAFTRPYNYRKYGFNLSSEIEALNRNDYNNINIPHISKIYMNAAVKIIRYEPMHYIKNMIFAYLIFTRPSSRSFPVNSNYKKLGLYEELWSDWLQGGMITKLLLPLTLLWYIGSIAIKAYKQSWSSIRDEDLVVILIVIVIAYTLSVSCAFEYGEQDRFKFLIEQPMWIIIISFIASLSSNS